MTAARRLTGERPLEGVTPDSLIALHDAGYREVCARLGPGRVLDVGCGAGFETVRLAGPQRSLVGVDYSREALTDGAPRLAASGGAALRCDAAALALCDGSFRWVCSSHLVEHFSDPSRHVAELARVLSPDGTGFVITPNAPADFENPHHLRLFGPGELAELLGRFFAEVEILGLDGSDAVKRDFAARRARAGKWLRLDVLGLRHRLPHRWYVAAYERLLPLAYRMLAAGDGGGASGITESDFFLTAEIDETTPVLFAVVRRPGPGSY
ncbi:MAG: class I SAM-dependent methyltransferase [Acidimicrobiales bacterium]